MRLLLDTHTFLWFIAGSSELHPHARKLIEEPESERFLSVASLWEMAIKVSLGKLEIASSMTELVDSQVRGNAIEVLAIAPHHLDRVVELPFHHRDPFDRLMIAQSLADDVPIVSRDATFDAYSVARLWAG